MGPAPTSCCEIFIYIINYLKDSSLCQPTGHKMTVTSQLASLSLEKHYEWADLPVNVVDLIARKLGGRDAVAMAAACRLWRKEIDRTSAWQARMGSEFGLKDPYSFSWKQGKGLPSSAGASISGDFPLSPAAYAYQSGCVRNWQRGRASLGSWEGSHEGWITGIALSSQYVITSSYDRTVKAFDRGSAVWARVWKGHTGQVTCVDCDGGRWVLTGSRDKTARLWSLDSDSCQEAFPAGGSAVTAVQLVGPERQRDGPWTPVWARRAPDSTTAASSHRPVPKPTGMWPLGGGGGTAASGLSGTLAVVGSMDGSLRTYNATGHSRHPVWESSVHGNAVYALTAVEAHKFASAGVDRHIRVWDTRASCKVKACRGHATQQMGRRALLTGIGPPVAGGADNQCSRRWSPGTCCTGRGSGRELWARPRGPGL